MASKGKTTKTALIEIHDHFDGCAHCVECQGACKLAGVAREVTSLIRFAMEDWAAHGFHYMPIMHADHIEALAGSLKARDLFARAHITAVLGKGKG